MRSILRRLVGGELTEAEAETELRRVQLEELGGRARLDLGRRHRRGLPEVVLAAGKEPAETAILTLALAREQGQGLVSRLGSAHRLEVERQAGEAGFTVLSYHAGARVLSRDFVPEPCRGRVGLLTAGTSDLPVADEAKMVVEACGLEARIEADLGVAGLHRLLGPLSEMLAWDPDVLVVAAGMDGVLPGVVAGLVDLPVIGLPVGVGYGLGGRGEAALLTMLQSCSTGLLVVNVDNGVGAGAAAALIARRASDRSADRSPTSGAASRQPRPRRSSRGSRGPAR